MSIYGKHLHELCLALAVGEAAARVDGGRVTHRCRAVGRRVERADFWISDTRPVDEAAVEGVALVALDLCRAGATGVRFLPIHA